MASEEYTSRINSPSSATYYHKAHSNHSQTHVESPLRKASFPVDTEAKDTFEKTKESQILRSRSEYALESETEDDEIHINAPTARISKYSGNGYDPPTEDLGPHGGNTEAEGGWIEETGYGVPILASDEVAKEPGSEYLQPAVSPVQERRGSAYYAGVDLDAPASYMSGHRNGSRSGSATNSRPSSRPGSVHGTLPGLSRFTSHDEREDIHTPLEDVDEYEPLFPEEEGEKEDRPVSAIDRFKHREMMKRRFPSQDIWEDTPNSLQLQATVETPEPAEEHVAPIPKDSAAAFESPETEAARKGEVNEEEKTKLIPREERLAKSNFKPHLYEGASRPGLKQRFPSRDIWEDSPDHAHLETTVREHQEEEARIPADEGLESGAVVHAAGRPDEPKVTEDTALDGTHTKAQKFERPSIPPRPARTNMSGGSVSSGDQPVPSVPARPPKRFHQVPPADIPHRLSKTLAEISPTELNDGSPSENRKPPGLPDRPKPQIPTRPARSGVRKEPEMAPLSKSTSVNSTSSVESKDENRELMSSPTAPKNKPALPSRSVGGKIASLKAGFLSDLDKRLQLGPQGSKPQEKAQAETEVQEDKAPLPDARKSRAKGPARRKPAAPSTLMATNILEGSTQEKRSDRYKWSIQDPWTVWQTEDDGSINAVHAARTGLMEEQADNALAPRNQSLQQQAVETSPRYMKSPEDATSPTKEASNEDQAGSGNGMAASTGYDLASASPQKETSVTAFSDKELTPPASSPPSEIYHTMSNATSQVDEKPSPISPATSRDDKPTADVIG